MTQPQYRINGIVIPENHRVRATLPIRASPSASSSLPGHCRRSTTTERDVIDIQTKQRFDNGGKVSLYGGSYATFSPSLELSGSKDKFTYYLTGTFFRSENGILFPTSDYYAIHDNTQQINGFAYAAFMPDSTSKWSHPRSSAGGFQIPMCRARYPLSPRWRELLSGSPIGRPERNQARTKPLRNPLLPGDERCLADLPSGFVHPLLKRAVLAGSYRRSDVPGHCTYSAAEHRHQRCSVRCQSGPLETAYGGRWPFGQHPAHRQRQHVARVSSGFERYSDPRCSIYCVRRYRTDHQTRRSLRTGQLASDRELDRQLRTALRLFRRPHAERQLSPRLRVVSIGARVRPCTLHTPATSIHPGQNLSDPIRSRSLPTPPPSPRCKSPRPWCQSECDTSTLASPAGFRRI